jgi:protein involved in polysaccharide export with SLBB domain
MRQKNTSGWINSLKAVLPLLALLAVSCLEPAGGEGTGIVDLPPVITDQPIRPGDDVAITLTDFPGGPASFDQKIPASGTIKLLHNQSFSVNGRLAADVQDEIRDRYVPDYYERMLVLVRANNQFFYIRGQVTRDSRYPHSSGLTILKAVATAGGFTPFARTRSVEVIRADGGSFKVDCERAKKNRSLDVPIYPGDQINVPRRLY